MDKERPFQTADLRSRIGSFWQDVANPDAVTGLVGLSMSNTLPDLLIRLMAGLLGDWNGSRAVQYKNFSFNPADVEPSRTSGLDPYLSRFGVGIEVRYGLRFPEAIPLKIYAPGRILVMGVDFMEGAGDWILFLDDPREIWPDGNLVMDKALLRDPNMPILTGMTGVPALANVQYVFDYVRSTPTVGLFAKALAALSGQTVLSQEVTITDREETAMGTRYYAGGHTFLVQGDHERMEVEETYPAGHILGTRTRVLDKTLGERWWQQARWSEGISGTPLGMRGLAILNDSVVYNLNGKGRVGLGPDDGGFWESWEGSGLSISDWLVSTYGPTETDAVPSDRRAAPGGRKASALDVLFEAGWKERALIVELEVDSQPHWQVVQHFMKNYLPADRTVIVLGVLKNLPGETWEVGDSFDTVEDIKVASEAGLDIPDTEIDLQSMVHEKITIG